jgi:tryptophanyl-tRNA synthetase
VPAGLLNYPVLQAADILLYRAELVPVGEDQLQHLELSREIARKWNARFDSPSDTDGASKGTGGAHAPGYFPEPQGLLTPTRRIMGLDGQAKMSKSLGNTVELLESPESIWEKLRPAVTDPKRVRRTDPGTPEVCNIYHLHKAFSPPATVEHVAVQCRTAGWGCIDCKRVLHESMERELAPIRARATEVAAKPERVAAILETGAERARSVARETMLEVKSKMGLR